jgi:hypothetical protein
VVKSSGLCVTVSAIPPSGLVLLFSFHQGPACMQSPTQWSTKAVSFVHDLFPVAIRGTLNNIRLFVVTSLYVATINIFYGLWDTDTIKCQLQIALNC